MIASIVAITSMLILVGFIVLMCISSRGSNINVSEDIDLSLIDIITKEVQEVDDA